MLKALRRRIRGGPAPCAARVTVQPHVSLPVRIGIVLLVAALGAALASGAWKVFSGDAATRSAVLEREATDLRERTNALQTERDRLAAIANAADAQLTIERTAAKQLAKQVKATEAENARLRADLAYLETLLPASGHGEPFAILRFRVTPEGAAHQIRYQALLTQASAGAQGKGSVAAAGKQSAAAPGEFRGTIALTVQVTLEGKPVTLQVPERGVDVPATMKVSFTRYQRIDGRFELPPGAVLRSVQMRLLEGTIVRAQESATPGGLQAR